YIVLTRHIKSGFNEFRESLIIYFICTINIIEVIVIHLGIKHYPLYKNVRIVSAVFDFACGSAIIIILLAKPVYMCLFHHNEYYAKWVQQILDDGLARKYDIEEYRTFVSASSYIKVDDSKFQDTNSIVSTTKFVESRDTCTDDTFDTVYKTSRYVV
ncbi:hypothetical protein GGI12_004377, partial [Dipsacomyces acuminosporus]